MTDIIEPNDVDCVLLVSSDYPRDRVAADALDAGLPFSEIAAVPDAVFNTLVDQFFATDRHGSPKGMVEVIGWN